MNGEVGLLLEVLEALGQGMVVLGPDRRALAASERALGWLAEYFPRPRHRGGLLPDHLLRWLAGEEGLPAGAPAATRPPLVVECDSKRLVVRPVAHRAHWFLLLEEQRTGLEPTALAPLGLTPREGEIMAWVSEGKTNPEVATILGISHRTVQTHLLRIYQKLGVETRTAAATRALQAASTVSSLRAS